MTTTAINDPLALAQRALGCAEGSTIDHAEKRVVIFCEAHASDEWPCQEAGNLAAAIREREEHFARQQRATGERAALNATADRLFQHRSDWSAETSADFWRGYEVARAVVNIAARNATTRREAA